MQIITDEFCSYLAGHDYELKEALRAIDGVPNAAYLVQDGRVFVFDKLMDLVRNQQAHNADKPLSDWVVPLVEQAMVTAEDAVTQWGIVPEPYELIQSPGAGWMIRHRAFNAIVPAGFTYQHDTYPVLAQLLVGKVYPGIGSFLYRGQPLVLCEPLDPTLLPPMPVIDAAGENDDYVYKVLGNLDYEPGFPPISESLFNTVKTLEGAWRNRSAGAVREAQDRAGELWAQLLSLPQLASLDDADDAQTDVERDRLAALRAIYPELSAWSDGSLYDWFDIFQIGYRFTNGWIADRDDDFLFYLLGNLVDRQSDGHALIQTGQWVGYALLRGDTPDQALAFARTAIEYDRAVANLARRVADAIHFLVEEKKGLGLRGRPVTTLLDMYRLGRKFNVLPARYTQQAFSESAAEVVADEF